MGVADHPILDLIQKARSWVVGGISGVFLEPRMSGGGGRPVCYECRGCLGAAPAARGLRCRSCNRVFCWKCTQSAGGGSASSGVEQQPRFCRFCFRAIVGPGEPGESRRGGEKASPLESPDWTPRSPLPRSTDSKPTQMVEPQHFSSSRPLCCSTHRNDEEEEGDEPGKNYFSPLSEFSQDVSDIDSVSISTGNEPYGSKSVASSPLDSPSRAFEQGDIVSPMSGSAGAFVQDSPDSLRRPGAEAEDLLDHSSSFAYSNISVYRNQEDQKAQQPLDFENNGLIWYPPPPEDEGDDAESGFVGFDDDDDEVGDSGKFFSSDSFGGEALRAKEKSNDSQKELLQDAVCGHFRALVSQLLKGEGIHVGNENGGEGWLEVVSSLAWEAANFVKPDTSRGGSMDPGNYVKVKCIASGRPSESTLIKGVVCTKNVKHKRMVSQHKNPRLFLLGGALEYQKVPNKLASINTVLEQEIDHLKMVVGRIEAHRPNVLLVEKTVSSYAQEYLLAKEISLVLNVKRPLLERIARCTGARIAPSIDNVASARLGQCQMFRVEKVFEESSSANNSNKRSSKTLMFFEGCPRRLGCTVLLRGTCHEELKKVKHVVQFASFAAYHLSLETSFLADEGAMLPKIPLGSPVTFHMKEMNSESNVSTFSSLSYPGTCQMTTDNHLTRGLCGDVGINCLSTSSNDWPLNKEILGINSGNKECKSSFNDLNSGDVLGLPLAHCQKNRNSIVGSTTNIPFSGSKGSMYGFHSKELRSPSHLSADVSIYQCEVVEESTKGSSLTGRRYLLSDDEHKNTDIDEGNEVPNEYFATAENHQSILVSLSSTCVLKGTVCEPSQLFRIKFYGSFDKPLGRYLRDDLFDQTSCCPSCKEPAEAHIRCYTHQHGSLTISVRRLSSMKLPGERDGRIWMWHRCLKCELKDGVPPAARRVVMSDAAWGLSFGKFLELSFSNHATANRIASCGHSLQKDCLRFYGFGSMVAFFRYSPVDILSVSLPPSLLDFTYHTQPEWVAREAAAILRNMEFLHEEISDILNGFERKITTSENEPLRMSIHKFITELKDLLKLERNEYEVLLEPVGIENSQPIQMTIDILELNRLRRDLLVDAYMWDRRLCLLDSFSKVKSYIPQNDLQFSEVLSDNKMNENRAEFFHNDVNLGNPPYGTTTKSSNFLGTPRKSLLSKQHDESSLQVLECNSSNLVEMDLSIESVEGYVGPAGLTLVSGHCNGWDEKQAGAEASIDTTFLENLPSPAASLSDKIDLAWTGSGQLVTDRPKDGLEVGSFGSLSLLENPSHRKAMYPVRVHSFDSALRFRGKIHGGLARASLHLSSVRSFDTSGGFASMIKDQDPNMQWSCSQSSPRTKQRLNILLNHRPTYISSVSRMLSDGARFLLPQTTLDDIVIVVYDDEPSSIISHAMTSQEYTEFITSKLDQPGLNGKEKTGIDAQMGNCTAASSSAVQRFQSDDTPSCSYGSDEPQPLRESLSDPKEAHFRISFDDEFSYHAEKVKFSVTCYFAKQFDALRRKCCPNEWDYVRSLCRCKRWSAQGGKSNVYFAKTLDERFIIKQVTKTELDSFEEFAPEYFKYLTDSITSGSPTCLAKVLGIYQVTAKHLKGGREVKMDLMVMENLFFRRNISRVYDLKGSLRSRYNPDTSGNNKVLLDMNLLETLRTKPIFLGSKAKRSLERAVWNDTSFLASVDVMDYSLLVGIDEERKELVIGIIDFMRQYTWDKHLETWVKASGILGGPKNASPTVVSPMQYKKRFRKAMSKYFPIVPDQWSS